MKMNATDNAIASPKSVVFSDRLGLPLEDED
jgi:hypothetical protein